MKRSLRDTVLALALVAGYLLGTLLPRRRR